MYNILAVPINVPANISVFFIIKEFFQVIFILNQEKYMKIPESKNAQNKLVGRMMHKGSFFSGVKKIKRNKWNIPKISGGENWLSI